MRELCNDYQCVVAQADIKQIRTVVSVASVGLDPAALKIEQLNVRYIRPILEEAEMGQRPEWKDIEDCNAMHKTRLGPMEIPRCEEQHIRAPLKTRQRTIKNSPEWTTF
jgi:hypothetical protein